MNGPASWMDRLPKVSRKLAESSVVDLVLPTELPDSVSSSINEALAELNFSEPEGTSCRLVSIVECDLFVEASDPGIASSIKIQINFEPIGSPALLVISASSARHVIDKILGRSDVGDPAHFSSIETAILEYLAARVLARINEDLGQDRFLINEISREQIPIFRQDEGGVAAHLGIESKGMCHSIKVLLSRGAFSGLRDKEWLFGRESGYERAARVTRKIGSVPVRAVIGSTRLETAAIASLEPGDVVIVETSELEWNGGAPAGETKLLAGSGNRYVLAGELTVDPASGPAMRILIKDISIMDDEEGYSSRVFMEDKNPNESIQDVGTNAVGNPGADQDTDSVTGSLPTLQNLQLRIRVELAGKRISLREIGSLRVGQVIDLGRGPTDSVDLVMDGSDEKIASGELVDIDGVLGVRLTKVFI